MWLSRAENVFQVDHDKIGGDDVDEHVACS